MRTTSNLDASRFKLELANRAIGLMLAADGAAEVYDAISDFLTVVRSVWMLVAQLGHEASKRSGRSMIPGEELQRKRFDAWFKSVAPTLMEEWLRADREIAKRQLRARPIAERGVAIGRIRTRGPSEPSSDRARPEDFYFDFDPARPALAVCAEFLDRITAFHADARQEATRLGLDQR